MIHEVNPEQTREDHSGSGCCNPRRHVRRHPRRQREQPELRLFLREFPDGGGAERRRIPRRLLMPLHRRPAPIRPPQAAATRRPIKDLSRSAQVIVGAALMVGPEWLAIPQTTGDHLVRLFREAVQAMKTPPPLGVAMGAICRRSGLVGPI